MGATRAWTSSRWSGRLPFSELESRFGGTPAAAASSFCVKPAASRSQERARANGGGTVFGIELPRLGTHSPDTGDAGGRYGTKRRFPGAYFVVSQEKFAFCAGW